MTDQSIFAAIEFATRAHSGQFRKGTRVPYIIHPLRVGQTLIECGATTAVVVAGVLHDTVEDTPVTRDQIASRFGNRVAELVEAVSEPDRKAGWEERKQRTIDQLEEAPSEALLVICADKLDNVSSMGRGERRDGAEFWQRFHRPKPRQAWYYQSVASKLRARAVDEPLTTMTRELTRAVDALFDPIAES